jgi:PLD-like domain
MPVDTLGGAIYYGHKTFADAQDNFLTTGTLVGSTLYRAPSDRYQARIEQSEFIVANVERGKEGSKTTRGQTGSFGPEISMHFKSYTRKNERGELEALLPTGNPSYSENQQLEESALYGLVKSVPFVPQMFGIGDRQDNTGVLFKGAAAEKILDFQKLLLSGKSVLSLELGDGFTLSRGDNTNAELLTSLDLAAAGDKVQINSPFLSHEQVLSSLISARARGADVNVIMGPGPRTDSTREQTKARLAKAGIKVFTTDSSRLVHQKNFAISGNTNITITGSDNFSHRSASNKTLDYSLIKKGRSALQVAVMADNTELQADLKQIDSTPQSFYATGEFGYLYETNYGTVNSRTQGKIARQGDTTGFIKSTKLTSAFFDRHIGQKLPIYSGFTSTYEAISGVKAGAAVLEMDKALRTPSIGHQINRSLGFKLYSDGLGLVGSVVSLAGRFTDYLTGHYAYKQDKQKRKGMRGSLRKFEAMLDQTQGEPEAYEGGPIEKGLSTLFSAAKSLVLVGVGYAAVLSAQYSTAAFLEQGAQRALEPSIYKTPLQEFMSELYLSPKGIEVNLLAQEMVAKGITTDIAYARRLAMDPITGIPGGVKPNEMLGGGTKVPALLNRMRVVSATTMDFLLGSVLPMVVPRAHLPGAMKVASGLVQAIGAPITMDETGLKNLMTDRVSKIGTAIEKLVSYIPAELHLWLPGLREATGAHGIPNPDPDPTSHYPLNNGRLSLGALMGQGAMQNTIASFIQTTAHFSQAVLDPSQAMLRLKQDYHLTRSVVNLDKGLVKALDAGTATEPMVRAFFAKQTELSEHLKPYGNAASIASRSSENGIMRQGAFKKILGRGALITAGVFVGDFLLDEFVLRNQGANLFQQLALTKAVRSAEGNVIQVELNGAVPITVAAAAAGASALTTGYIFPTVYGASKYSSMAMQSLANSSIPELAQTKVDFDKYQGTRARFNFKAAAIGTVLGLVGLKAAFIGAAAVGNLFFPTKGVKLDPESDVVSSKLLSILNRTQSRDYEIDSDGGQEIRAGVSLRSIAARQQLKLAQASMHVSDIRPDNRSPGSNFYSVALQLTNTGFIQTAIVQRTDALQQRTSYSFGIQLFASAGMGLTPNLPIGILTQRQTSKDKQALSRIEDEALQDRYGLIKDQSRIGGLAQKALDMFGFISYEPNSQISKGLLGLGALGYIAAAADRIEQTYAGRTAVSTVRPNYQTDIEALGKVARLGLNLTTTFIKYSTALTDFLPRMIGVGIRSAIPELGTTPHIGVMRKLAAPVARAKFAILGYALGVAMSDPYLGVEALDNNSSQAKDNPFSNPISRLVAAVSLGAYTAYAADAIGLAGKAQPNSLLSKLIPGAAATQAQLYDPGTSSLRKSGARMSLIAGALFATYSLAQIAARTIGMTGGKEALTETYKRVGLLRILSGVSAEDYTDLSKRNLIGDLATSFLEKLPFVGESIVKLTGLYKDDAKLHAPLLGTPFGGSYDNKQSSTRGYGQVSNVTSDVSMSTYTKFAAGFSKEDIKRFQRLEEIDFTRFEDPDLVARQVLEGGTPRSSKMKVSDVSPYAINAIQEAGGSLSRAFQVKLHQRNWVRAQRAAELLSKDINKGVLFGFIPFWNGKAYVTLPKTTIDPNLGLIINTVDRLADGTASGATGNYTSFTDAITSSTYKDQNIYTPALFQGVQDMYAAYSPAAKKREKNMMGAAIIGTVGTVTSLMMVAGTLLGVAEMLGAIEVVKFGQSSVKLQQNRTTVGSDFRSRNRINIELGSNPAGQPTAELSSNPQRHGVGFQRSIDLAPFGQTDIKSLRRAYTKGLYSLETFFKASPHSLNAYQGGVATNVYDMLLNGQIPEANNHLRGQFVREITNKKTGILGIGVGSSSVYNMMGPGQTNRMTAVEYASNVVAPANLYQPLGAYAVELNSRTDLETWQKRELLAARKVQLEMSAAEEHIFSQRTNTIGNAAGQVAEAAPTLELGRGLGHSMKRAASGFGTLMAGYFVFGKDAYSLAEGVTFLAGKDKRLQRYASEQIVGTVTNLAVGLSLQKLISGVMGTNQYGMLTLGLIFAASYGLNFAAEQMRKSSIGRSFKSAERNTVGFFATGLEAVGNVVASIPVVNVIPELLGKFIFRPLGATIQRAYNDAVRNSSANLMLMQMFLPESIFKTSNFVTKQQTFGRKVMQMPFVVSDSGELDLSAYYRSQNAADLMQMMRVGNSPKYVSDFALGRSSQKDYVAGVLYQRYFDSQNRTAASPLANMGIGSTYHMSEQLISEISRRAGDSDRVRFGRLFRRPKRTEHNYIGQAFSGLGLGNELTRISTQAQSGVGRPLADAFAQVDRTLFNPIRRVSSSIFSFTQRVSSTASHFLGYILNPISQALQGFGSSVGRFFGGAKFVSTALVSSAAQSAVAGTYSLNLNIEQKLQDLGEVVGRRFAGPISRITLEALSGSASLVSTGSSLVLNLLSKAPAIKPIIVPEIKVPEVFGANIMPTYTKSKAMSALADGIGHAWKFLRGNLPFYLDVGQLLPSTYALQGDPDARMTKVEYMRLQEQQGAAVGGTLLGLASVVLRANLISSIAISVGGSLLGGYLGKEGGRNDYNNNQTRYKDLQIIAGYVTMGLSAIQSLVSYYRRIDIYNNFVEVAADEHGTKYATAMYAENFTSRIEKNQSRIDRIEALPDSKYRTQQLQHLKQQRLNLKFEYHHEQAHVTQFDVASQKFVLSTDAVMADIKAQVPGYSTQIDNTLRKLAEVSAQDRLYSNPEIDSKTYHQIVELEYQAQVRSFVSSVTEAEPSSLYKHTPEEYADHYAHRLERQLSRGRSYRRSAGALGSGASAAEIDRLYNPGGGANSVTPSGTSLTRPGSIKQVTEIHLHKFAALTSSGFARAGRSLEVFGKLTALPTAAIESLTQKEELQNLQSTYGTSSARAVKTALLARADRRIDYVYTNAITGILGAIFQGPVALLGLGAYGFLASFGGSIPFTNIKLSPTLARSELKEIYSNYMRSKMQQGEYAYEPWATSSGPINALRHHHFDASDRQIVFKVSRAANNLGGEAVKDTVGYFNSRKLQRNALSAAIAIAALTYVGTAVFGLRDTNLAMFTVGGLLATGIAYRGAKLAGRGAIAFINKTPAIMGYFVKGLDMSNADWTIAPNGKASFGSLALMKSQGAVKSTLARAKQISSFFAASKLYLLNYNRVTEVGAITGLPTKYAGSSMGFIPVNIGSKGRAFLNAVAILPRVGHAIHKPIRMVGMVYTNVTHHIENFGVGAIRKQFGISPITKTTPQSGLSLKLFLLAGKALPSATTPLKVSYNNPLSKLRLVAGSSLAKAVLGVTTAIGISAFLGTKSLGLSGADLATFTSLGTLGLVTAGVAISSIARTGQLRSSFAALTAAGTLVTSLGANGININLAPNGIRSSNSSKILIRLKPLTSILPKFLKFGLAPLVIGGLIYKFNGGGMDGFKAVTTLGATIGAVAAIAKAGQSLTVGRAISHHIVQQGLFGTSLSAYALATEGAGIVSTSYNFATKDPNKNDRVAYQQAYINTASHTSGLITTLTLIPKLGVLRGIAASIALTIGMTAAAQKSADERYLQRQTGTIGKDYGTQTALVLGDLVRPAIQQTFMAGELTNLAKVSGRRFLQTSLVQGAASRLGQVRVIRGVLDKTNAWKSSASFYKDAADAVIQARAAKVFGSPDAVTSGLNSLKSAATTSANLAGTFFKGALTAINVGMVAYGLNQIRTAETSEERKEGYRNTFSSGFALFGGAVSGVLSAPLNLAGPAGTAANIGIAVTASVALGYLGDLFGQGLAHLHSESLKTNPKKSAANFMTRIGEYIFGGAASASEPPSTYDRLLIDKGLKKEDPNFNPFDSLNSLATSISKYSGSQWNNFRIGIGNLYKNAKLKWGRFANRIVKGAYIYGAEIKQAIATTAENLGNLVTGKFQGGGKAIVISIGHVADRGSGEGGSDRNTGSATLKYIDSKGKVVYVSGVTGEGTANLVVAERIMAYGKARGYNIINALPSGPVGLGTHLKDVRALADANNAYPIEIHHDDRHTGKGGLISSRTHDKLGEGLASVYGYYGGTKLFGAPHSEGGRGRFKGGFGAYNKGVNILEVERLSDKQEYGSLVIAYHRSLVLADEKAQLKTRAALDAYVDRVIVPKFFQGVTTAGISPGRAETTAGQTSSNPDRMTTPDTISQSVNRTGSGKKSRATLTASFYTPGGGGINGGKIDSRGNRVTRDDYSIATPGRNLIGEQIPYGSIVTLTYGGKTVRATVRDGGPYFPGRQLDMTLATGKALGFTGVGEVGVRLESLPSGADPNKRYYFGEATYTPKFGKGGGYANKSEPIKAVNSVVRGNKYLILGEGIQIDPDRTPQIPAGSRRISEPSYKTNQPKPTLVPPSAVTRPIRPPAPALNPTMPPKVSPAQADRIMKRVPVVPALPKLKAEASTTNQIAIKYGEIKSTAPVVAGKPLPDFPKRIAINLSVEDGQLKATATQTATSATYFSQVNVPPSSCSLNGMALNV